MQIASDPSVTIRPRSRRASGHSATQLLSLIAVLSGTVAVVTPVVSEDAGRAAARIWCAFPLVSVDASICFETHDRADANDGFLPSRADVAPERAHLDLGVLPTASDFELPLESAETDLASAYGTAAQSTSTSAAAARTAQKPAPQTGGADPGGSGGNHNRPPHNDNRFRPPQPSWWTSVIGWLVRRAILPLSVGEFLMQLSRDHLEGEAKDRPLPVDLALDENNSIRLEHEEPGKLHLTTLDDGVERTETRWVQWKGHRAVARARADGTIIASKALTDLTWTLNLRALPDDLAQKIRELPALVWDEQLLRKLPPLVPWTGDQYVTINGVTYIRNNVTQELRAFSIGSAPRNPNAAQMMAGDGSTTGNGGTGNGEPPEDDEDEPLVEPLFTGWKGRYYIGPIASEGLDGFPALVREGEKAIPILETATEMKISATEWLRDHLPEEPLSYPMFLEPLIQPAVTHHSALTDYRILYGYTVDANYVADPREDFGQPLSDETAKQSVPWVFGQDSDPTQDEDKDRKSRILEAQQEYRFVANLGPHGFSDLSQDGELIPYVTGAWDAYAYVDDTTLIADPVRFIRTNPSVLDDGPHEKVRPDRVDPPEMTRQGDYIYYAISAEAGGRDVALMMFMLVERARSYSRELAHLIPPVEVVTLDDGHGGAVLRTLYSDEASLTNLSELDKMYGAQVRSGRETDGAKAAGKAGSETTYLRGELRTASGGLTEVYFGTRRWIIESREPYTYADGSAASCHFRFGYGRPHLAEFLLSQVRQATRGRFLNAPETYSAGRR